ncbi:EamA family transporter [Sediminibacillus dalangtanensis]|uniref:EamA family transporter n=1 Tax=Sediminibacillus dalangtanensis TaxID=2729421 RepID=A0ABX7VWA9_9BACI|nr:EamA family transporter [Sediminibacillus dalangtanensis]QTN00824.1 EamA family transporter [Sediminibacillus dalangtanensis]
MINWLMMIVLFTLFGALGGFFFKKASGQDFTLNSKLLIHLLAGGMFYGAGAILNVWTLKHLPYTVVFPLTSLTYVWTLLLSSIWLRETLTKNKIVGVLLIVAGSAFLVT